MEADSESSSGSFRWILSLDEVLVAFELQEFGLTLQKIRLFLDVCMNEGTTVAEIENRIQMKQSSISRNLDALGPSHRLGKPGLNLVCKTPDPTYPKRHKIFLTAKGKRLRNLIEQKLGSHAQKETSTRY